MVEASTLNAPVPLGFVAQKCQSCGIPADQAGNINGGPAVLLMMNATPDSPGYPHSYCGRCGAGAFERHRREQDAIRAELHRRSNP